MSYVESVLQPGETIRFTTNIHWIKSWRGLALLVLAIIIYGMGERSGVLPLVSGATSLACAGLAVAFLLHTWFQRWTTEIAITDRRIIRKTGFLSRKTMEMSLNKVENVQVDQSILGRVFGYGDIILKGTGGGEESLRTIADALEFRSHVTAQ